MTAAPALVQHHEINALTQQLLEHARPGANAIYLAQIIGSMLAAHSALPSNLGLTAAQYRLLVGQHFDAGFDSVIGSYVETFAARGAMRQSLLDMRRDEWNEIRALLLGEIENPGETDIAMADIVAAGCLGSGHLWRDLGLDSRIMLREMLNENFPQLTARNDRDMRWKKFFYKQLCDQEGGHVCRSPSCDACSNYDDCFGEET